MNQELALILFFFFAFTAFFQPSARAVNQSDFEQLLQEVKADPALILALPQKEIAPLLALAQEKALEPRRQLYPASNYLDEYPSTRWFARHNDHALAAVIAHLYLRKERFSPDEHWRIYNGFTKILDEFVSDQARAPELKELDLEAIMADPEKLKSFLHSLREVDQFYAGRLYSSDGYKKVQDLSEEKEHRIDAFEALFKPIKYEAIDKLGAVGVKILQLGGWPKPEDVGQDASLALWLIIQHDDDHPKRQQMALPILKEAVEKYGVRKRFYAYLDDRINSNHGRKQRFGTQLFGCNVRTLVDPSKVNEWRADYGLGSLEDYMNCDPFTEDSTDPIKFNLP